MKKKTAAMYLRLSDEDDGEQQNESNSIRSQREILLAYIGRDEELQEYRILEFCDDGFSGTDFERPQIQKLLEQVRKNEISCILVKDFSRFGRNYIEVGHYIEQVFPFLGVRFISVNDCFDSNTTLYSGEFIDTAFKNLVYDLYSKDLSEKITCVRRARAKQGKFVTAHAPYGFRKTPENRLAADGETAPVVRRIFAMALAGIPKTHIAAALNREGIASPLAVRKRRGQQFACNQVGDKCFWSTSVISKILKDQRYTGDAVYGKVRPAAPGSKKDTPVPEEEWIVVSNCHEQIVAREVFEAVEAMLEKRSAYRRSAQTSLSGMVRCAACNHIISRKPTGETAVYRCQTLRCSSEFGCFTGKVAENRIEELLLFLLKGMSAIAALDSFWEKLRQDRADKVRQIEKFLVECASDKEKINSSRLARYEAYRAGSVSKAAFLRKKAEEELMEERLEEACSQAKRRLAVLRRMESKDKVGGHEAPFVKVTRGLAQCFVRQISICGDGSLQVLWRFEDFLPLS